jgi:acetylornithine aminotransferase
LGTTFGGNHLASVAGIAVLDVLKAEKLIENARKTGEFLLEELRKIPQIKEVRGVGLMIGIEFEQPMKEIRDKLLYEHRIFTGATGIHTIRLLPPLCLTVNDAAMFIDKLKKVLA